MIWKYLQRARAACLISLPWQQMPDIVFDTLTAAKVWSFLLRQALFTSMALTHNRALLTSIKCMLLKHFASVPRLLHKTRKDNSNPFSKIFWRWNEREVEGGGDFRMQSSYLTIKRVVLKCCMQCMIKAIIFILESIFIIICNNLIILYYFILPTQGFFLLVVTFWMKLKRKDRGE